MSYEDQLIREMTEDQGLPEPEDTNQSTETDGGCPTQFKPWEKMLNTMLEKLNASHLSQSDADTADLSKTESFTQWLDQQGDALAAPDSFDTWLRQNEDSI